MEQPQERGRGLDADADAAELSAERESVGPTPGQQGPRVVGIGGSAGSIEALQQFFAAMPADPGMAFVVVVHLSPEHESMLASVLQRSTAMKVSEVGDGDAVQPNHVYVIPPAKLLSVVDGQLRLTELAREPGRRTTVDLFFRSLADGYGARAVAIVLSGSDGDGAVGVKRIKERGGLTIAQDPAAAEHAGMPTAAIATNMVDWVLLPQEMPGRLRDYHERGDRLQVPPETGPNPALTPSPAGAEDETALRDVLTLLRTRTGRDFSYYKRATIVRRIARRMQVNAMDDLPAYLSFLRTHPGEAGALLQDLLISVTNFFRDREAFEALEGMIPELFKQKQQSDCVRVWVPACATGEEAYSIAILLSEHARTLEAPPSIQVFATDLHEQVLAEARSGLYPDAIVTDVSAERLRRYFVKERQGYRVRRELREMLLFAVHDLLKDSPFSRLDMVSCRNLLIYLNRSAQQRTFDIFHFALRAEGRLFLGSSESVDDPAHRFYPVDKKHRIYSVRAAARANLPVPSGPSTLARSLQQGAAQAVPFVAKPSSSVAPALGSLRPSQDRLAWSELHLRLIERIGPPSLLVNGEHDILHLSESAAPLLQFAGGEPSTNLLRVVHPDLRIELRAALFRARQSGQTSLAEGIVIELGQHKHAVDIRVSPAPELAADFLLITFTLRDVGEERPVVREQDAPIVEHLESELEQTKGQLRDIVEQNEASVEELKASNEELQAMNEELRSATEELETSREELQSINEELTTVNQELKSKVDELGDTNSDLHNLMGATAIATVFLDRKLQIMRFTPPAVELFSVIQSDLGRPLADLQHRLDYPQLLDDAARVLHSLVPIEREVRDVSGRGFLARVLPYRTTEDRIAGVVLTFIDVSERQVAEAALRRAQQDLEVRVKERTAELDAVNGRLQDEVRGHQDAEKARQELQRRLVNAQEEERSRISRELHDEVGQQLTALMLAMKALESPGQELEMPAKLRELRAGAEKVGREIHEVAYKLRPIALDELGLVRALTDYLEDWRKRTGIAVDFVSAGIEELRLPTPLETTLYRIVQEAMNNVLKHASAKNVSVSIERRGEHVLCIVEDDGAGFEPDGLNERGDARRIGLAGMRERAAIIGGALTIESSAGQGTTIRAKLPLPRA